VALDILSGHFWDGHLRQSLALVQTTKNNSTNHTKSHTKNPNYNNKLPTYTNAQTPY